LGPGTDFPVLRMRCPAPSHTLRTLRTLQTTDIKRQRQESQDMSTEATLIKQHLIDPEICIRCNTCEATCPVGAITHDDRNYVVDASKCNLCMDCIAPCPTGSIDNWRTLPLVRAYSVDEQLGWDELPGELSAEQLQAESVAADTLVEPGPTAGGAAAATGEDTPATGGQYGATLPPWSAAHAYTNLYGPKAPEKSVCATVTGNVRVTEIGREYDTHHIVLDFGAMPFPVLEGQSHRHRAAGNRRQRTEPHHPRQYTRSEPAQWRAAGLQQPVAHR
jgi:benzoyl-CoA 2,3-epoxidase subunit A